jgi:hypothetical protein
LLADAFDPQQLLLFAGIALFVLTMVRISVRRARRSREQAVRERGLRQPPHSPERTVVGDQHAVELTELFRELGARLDTKMHVLNELLIEAEQRIGELRRLTGTAAPVVRPGQADDARATPPGFPDESLVVEPELPASANPPPTDGSPRGVNNSAPTARPPLAEIHALADQGLSAQQISDQLSQPIGEIELILGLRRRRQQATRSPIVPKE